MSDNSGPGSVPVAVLYTWEERVTDFQIHVVLVKYAPFLTMLKCLITLYFMGEKEDPFLFSEVTVSNPVSPLKHGCLVVNPFF